MLWISEASSECSDSQNEKNEINPKQSNVKDFAKNTRLFLMNIFHIQSEMNLLQFGITMKILQEICYAFTQNRDF
jgi:hypothetical protein